ncbi:MULTISPECIES: 16S rRNA (guanine(527)-N(7))-methyltransferase RsmG [Phyllobacteriaceae]|uniref:Ribosomal RNA small subunit methyltransferase G n=1 Tax=Mesorhizobium hungaricum TaxID=1566387 RepID=A0A1C2DEF2_9HYPH|nr:MULTISPECIES: 16S rRNA (guanine(527)-N(7))-methyltransferase RsmG [Mesorhizobium]MBN9232804.1 16S rRNA (guanine(527)-N(7))-methyltransferase RsmG [Mesorhizobium sp.]MDQ0330406.1 16S rRNA (guanine527-N7)-methyltransferase [Mesorhizobium sp. YL-MeA3-2017]OCX13103.1 16S rRNA (guanine(527)-N(7))-methyltransferase [Mesorhizobium hungaricum]
MSTASFESLQDVAGHVSRETFERLRAFETHFLKWNNRINLIAASTEAEIWQRHILDSAQLAALEPLATKWVDIGSGGGFPGLVMAFLLGECGGTIDLVESNRKKTGFLQATVGEFRLPARIVAKRIEDSYPFVKAPEVVTARALAPLTDLLGLAEPWLAAGARALFHKGRDYEREIEESAHRWRFDLLKHGSLIDPQGVVLDLRNVRRA